MTENPPPAADDDDVDDATDGAGADARERTGETDDERGLDGERELDGKHESERGGDDGVDADSSRTGSSESAPSDASSTESAPADGSSTESASTDPSGSPSPGVPDESNLPGDDEVPPDVQKYERFKKMDGAQYERVNDFLRERTYVTAREWAIARLCSDFRTETGVEMTKIGENLPELVPFMTDTYTPQAVNQARSSFEEKVRKAGATFLYGAMCDFFTAEELDDVMYESTEVAKFLLEVEGVDLAVDEELDAEERISSVMREVRSASEQLRED